MRLPYARLYHSRQWKWHRSTDIDGPCYQLNFGRLGITIPLRNIPRR